jgi:hypothetical protein
MVGKFYFLPFLNHHARPFCSILCGTFVFQRIYKSIRERMCMDFNLRNSLPEALLNVCLGSGRNKSNWGEGTLDIYQG